LGDVGLGLARGVSGIPFEVGNDVLVRLALVKLRAHSVQRPADQSVRVTTRDAGCAHRRQELRVVREVRVEVRVATAAEMAAMVGMVMFIARTS
jgi:hypothetical protein